MTTLNLRTLKLRPGEQFRDTREIAVDPFELGGERYDAVPDRVDATVTVTRASSGLLFELELQTRVVGPCMRCLADAGLTTPIRGSEYQATSPGEVDDLKTPYLRDDLLDLSAWSRDAIALALPDKILCRPDCAGLCPTCGRDLNREPHEHADEAVDPRWAALADLRDRL